MAMLERGKCKAAVTRLLTKWSWELAKKEDEGINNLMAKIKEYFTKLETAHDEVITLKEGEDNLENLKAENAYLNEIGIAYVKCLKEFDEFKKSATPNDDTAKLAKLLTLPKIELPKYNGDVMHYHTFMAVFRRNIHSLDIRDDDKLTHLYDCMVGRARLAIQYCVTKGGTEGYTQALKTLEERFGDRHLLADTIKRQLCSFKAVKGPTELRELADLALNADLILKETSLYAEVDSQTTISTILDRLAHHNKLRWRREAVSYKTYKGVYPNFEQFTVFLNSLAVEAQDPVYGYNDVSTVKYANL